MNKGTAYDDMVGKKSGVENSKIFNKGNLTRRKCGEQITSKWRANK